MMASEETAPKILLFPYLAHGHISPFLELARKLSKHKFVVYFCSTPDNLKEYASKLVDSSIRAVEFHLPSSVELPTHYNTTNALPPNLVPYLVKALHNSGPVFSDILKSVQPDLVIYDIHRQWLPPLAASYHIPALYFQTTSATTVSYSLYSYKFPHLQYPFKGIFFREYEIKELIRKHQSEDLKNDREKLFWSSLEQSNEIILIRSSRAFEAKYIDLQSQVTHKNMITLGSLVREPENDLDDDSPILQWLNGKEEASTVYVSFGSEICLTKEELEEIALGLEVSNVNFIWVVRSPYGYKTRVEEVLPAGFVDRIKGKGFVEEVWAPQPKILRHPSIGAFICHCGWGSVMESISYGVPIIAMPIQHDQPLNARLVVELGVGLEVVADQNGKWKGEEIAQIIKKILLKDDGETIRIKSRELGEKVRVKSEEEIDGAIQELRGICEKKKKKNHML